MELPFIEVDHSGDIGIEATGGNIGELIENLTRGLFSLMHRGEVTPRVVRSIRVHSSSIEELLIDWLSEVIASSGVHGELYGSVFVERADENSAQGILGGEAVDPDRHNLRFEVKAATYHRLVVEKREDGLLARVIFDL